MKICNHCGDEKGDDQFNWRNKATGTRQGYCRECKKLHQKKYYRLSKPSYLAKIYETRAKRLAAYKAKIKSYLLAHPCVDCGNADIRALHFDHVSGVKETEVTKMFHQGASWSRIEAEMAKCEIRCANCHMIKTWPERWQ